MKCMPVLKNQSLQYLDFIYEQKVLNYALEQGIWRILFSILVNIFLKLRKKRGDFPPSLPNYAHDR